MQTQLNAATETGHSPTWLYEQQKLSASALTDMTLAHYRYLALRKRIGASASAGSRKLLAEHLQLWRQAGKVREQRYAVVHPDAHATVVAKAKARREADADKAAGTCRCRLCEVANGGAQQIALPCTAQCPGCSRTIEEAVFCNRCWARLPEPVQQNRKRITSAMTRPDAVPILRANIEEIVEQSARRLAAELAGPLPPNLERRAHELCQAMRNETFADLLTAHPGYWPKLECSRRFVDAEQQARNQELADLYDRAQAARGDKRRATRLSFCGL